MPIELGAKLRALRKCYGYSAKKLVHLLEKRGLSYKEETIYKWEQENCVPNIKTLKCLSEIFHCSMSILLSEPDVEYKNLSSFEIFLLHLYRNDFLFRSISVQIMRRLNSAQAY